MAVQYWEIHDEGGNIVDYIKKERYEDEDGVPRKYIERESGSSVYKHYLEPPVFRIIPGYAVRVATKADRDAWMEARYSPEYYDIVGRKVEVGSRVAVAFSLGRGAEMRVGHVVGWDKQDSGYSHVNHRTGVDESEQIVIEWEVSNAHGTVGESTYGMGKEKGNRTKIFAYLRRYVVISD